MVGNPRKMRNGPAVPYSLTPPRSRPGPCSTSTPAAMKTSPTSSSWPDCTAPALEHLGVGGCPKVTGKRGIQIWVPVARGYTFTETRAWVATVSRAIGGTTPELVSWEWEVQRRRRSDPARLHPERHQQDPRRPLQHTSRSRRTRLGADHLGRPRRRPAPPGQVDHPRHPTTPATARRSPCAAHRPPTTPPTALTSNGHRAGAWEGDRVRCP